MSGITCKQLRLNSICAQRWLGKEGKALACGLHIPGTVLMHLSAPMPAVTPIKTVTGSWFRLRHLQYARGRRGESLCSVIALGMSRMAMGWRRFSVYTHTQRLFSGIGLFTHAL